MTLRGCASGRALAPATRAMVAASGAISTVAPSSRPMATSTTSATTLVAVVTASARGFGRAGALLRYQGATVPPAAPLWAAAAVGPFVRAGDPVSGPAIRSHLHLSGAMGGDPVT